MWNRNRDLLSNTKITKNQKSQFLKLHIYWLIINKKNGYMNVLKINKSIKKECYKEKLQLEIIYKKNWI